MGWAFLFVHFLGGNSSDCFLLLAGKPIGHTHDNAEKAKAEYNHHDAHNAFISYITLGAGDAVSPTGALLRGTSLIA